MPRSKDADGELFAKILKQAGRGLDGMAPGVPPHRPLDSLLIPWHARLGHACGSRAGHPCHRASLISHLTAEGQSPCDPILFRSNTSEAVS
jgi:hypothetical protein